MLRDDFLICFSIEADVEIGEYVSKQIFHILEENIRPKSLLIVCYALLSSRVAIGKTVSEKCYYSLKSDGNWIV